MLSVSAEDLQGNCKNSKINETKINVSNINFSE